MQLATLFYSSRVNWCVFYFWILGGTVKARLEKINDIRGTIYESVMNMLQEIGNSSEDSGSLIKS